MSSEASSDSQWTIGRVLTWSTTFLQEKGLTDSPRLDAEVLLSHALKMTRIQLYTDFDKPLTSAEREPFKANLKRRSAGEPVAYITGEKEFMGLRFQVDPAVLIPRPDTEILVETALSWLKNQAAPRVLDIGTGSGCIALSVSIKMPTAEVTAWDLDPGALQTALANQASLGTSVDFCIADALAAASYHADSKLYDLIVSNPPYISPDEEPSLPTSVRCFEPKHALFAAPDGLAFYRALAALAGPKLSPGGLLMVEIGSEQAAAVTAILAAAGWQNISCHKDYGRLDRVLTASRPNSSEVPVE